MLCCSTLSPQKAERQTCSRDVLPYCRRQHRLGCPQGKSFLKLRLANPNHCWHAYHKATARQWQWQGWHESTDKPTFREERETCMHAQAGVTQKAKWECTGRARGLTPSASPERGPPKGWQCRPPWWGPVGCRAGGAAAPLQRRWEGRWGVHSGA